MPAKLRIFPPQGNLTLRVFCPNKETIITSFESHLPNEGADNIPDIQPHLPAKLCWFKMNYGYYAFLPKECLFDGHLLAPLKHHEPKHVQKDGRWFVDDETRKLWQSLDINITKSINVIGAGLLVELEHREPSKAFKFGFSSGHKNQSGLRTALKLSRNALIHRLAYFTYLLSHRYNWDRGLVDQAWWNDLRTRCGNTWVDSLWDAVYRQWEARNFIGVAVRPTSSSLRWLGPALSFGVPVWVLFPSPACYKGIDGDFIMSRWEPTNQMVASQMEALGAKSTTSPPFPDLPMNFPPEVPADLPPEPPAHPPSEPLVPSESISPPTKLPQNTRWYESWKDYFRKRNEDDEVRLEAASEADKSIWGARAQNAEKFRQPGNKGARVHVWETCDSGGFLRVEQSRFEVSRDWDSYHNEGLIFNPQRNIWDYCPFVWESSVQDTVLDDDEDEHHIMEHWYTEPALPTNLPEDNPEPLEFLYHRYGFLSIEPSAPPQNILPFSKSSAYRTVGLEVESSGKYPEHLNSFLTYIIQGQIPAGHCDLSPTSPPDETLLPSSIQFIRDTVFLSGSLEPLVFIFVNPADSQLLAAYDSLSVLQVARDGTPPQLKAQLQYLLYIGSQFRLLYPEASSSVSHKARMLTFPLRDESWTPSPEDFRAYMSRLKTLFLERPYVAAAAFSRGGIAWRIAREVLGIEESVEILLTTRPDQQCSVRTTRGKYWIHEPHEGEWFYLVGGYEMLTGLWFLFDELCCAYCGTGKGHQTKDLSWFPKITTWDGSGIDVGCWTPMCERWFRKRLESIKGGMAGPYSSQQWQKNLRYGKETKKFITSCKNIGHKFLVENCSIRNM